MRENIATPHTPSRVPPPSASSEYLRYYIHEALEEHFERGDLVEVILRYRILEKEE